MSNEAIQASIRASAMREGVQVLDLDGTPQSGADLNAFMFTDTAGTMQVGPLPFAAPLFAGVTNTGFSVAAISGSATGSANELMHLTLVSGANATAVIAGYYRVTVTDNAGVITTGDYYAPFYTLG